MAFRPTISVYYDMHIVDFGYYRDWDELDVLYSAVFTYANYADCRTAEEYLKKRYRMQKEVAGSEPKKFEESENELKWLESLSEWPIILDMTEKCIYCANNMGYQKEYDYTNPFVIPEEDEEWNDPNCAKGIRALTHQELLQIPKARIEGVDDCISMMRKYKVPLAHLDVDEIMKIKRKM